jgi:GNAT superfamily N-acetyltransferase
VGLILELIQLKSKQKLFGLRGLCQEFSDSVNKNLNWNHWHHAIGGLIDNKISDCLVVKNNDDYLGMLIWSYFPCLISAELSATEICFYVSDKATGCGVKLLKKMIDICKEKNVKNINMAHFYNSDRVGMFYEALGFEKSEISYTFKIG